VVIIALKVYVLLVVLVMVVYAVRHYMFVNSRVAGEQRAYYQDIVDSDLPFISVLIPMHNEQEVASNVLDALIKADYPTDKLEIIPINDHSTDRTKEILDEYAEKCSYLKPLHRFSGKRGKSVALNDALKVAKGEIVLVFDADYVPPRGILNDLATSFKNPEVGSVMGRVIPENTKTNLLTRLLDLERTGGYQVDQQARYNLGLTPQYGGTVGGFRRSVVLGLGGFDPESLTEDTELTFKLLVKGWKIVYANRAECYEEVPADWNSRANQIKRWSRGHTQTMFKFLSSVIKSPYLRRGEKFDGVLLLFVYTLPVLLLTGFIDSITLFFLGEMQLVESLLVFLFVAGYNTFGNFAPFYQVGIAAFLDGATARIKLLPFLLFSFIFNLWYISQGFFGALWDRIRGGAAEWQKTRRYRKDQVRKKKGQHPLPLKTALLVIVISALLVNLGVAKRADMLQLTYSYDEIETIEVRGGHDVMEEKPVELGHNLYVVVALLLLYCCMLMVPFVPAAMELFNPKDDEHLHINMNYTKDPRYFGRSFRKILNNALGTEELAGGTKQVKLSKDEVVEIAESKSISSGQSLDKVQYIIGDLSSDKGVEIKSDVYIKGKATIGADNSLRAMACDGDVSLGNGSQVVRWVDAEGSVVVGSGCKLGFSCSSGKVLKLDKGCKFKRLFGKPIVTYNHVEAKDGEEQPTSARTAVPKEVETIEDVATLVKGDLKLSSSYYKGKRVENLIVKGDLTIDAGVVLGSSVSVYGKVVIGKGAKVLGDVFSEGAVDVKEGAAILGNVFSQRGVYLGKGARVGRKGGVKSVIGKSEVKLAEGVCIYGYVLTEGEGATA